MKSLFNFIKLYQYSSRKINSNNLLMKIFYIFLAISCLFSSCQKDPVRVDIPWLISLGDSEIVNYKVADTLKKYNGIDADNVINKAQFLSFKANLSAMAKDSTSVRKYLYKAFSIDSTGVYENLLAPIHSYLVQDRPDRKTKMSPILDYELDYVIDLFEKCNLQVPEGKKVEKENSRLFYWFCYIRLRDQWYRVPQREADWETQTKIDIENQKLFDQIFIGKNFPEENYFKWFLQVLLLHSDNADWTFKWLNVYLDTFENDQQTLSFISHFNNRSYVSHDPRIQELLKNYEDSDKNLN